MNFQTSYKALADAIYRGPNSNDISRDHSSDEVTLTEAIVVNGKTLNPGATLKIQRPVVH